MSTPNQPSNGRPGTEQQSEPPTRDAEQSSAAPSLPAHQGPPPQGQRPPSRPRPPQGQPPQGQPPRQAPTQQAPTQQAPAQQRPPLQPVAPNPSSTAGGPPWQRSPQQAPTQAIPDQQGPTQRQPQTNLSQRPGQAPYQAPAGADERTRDRSREEAKTKAAAIDGPTRNIARNDLPVDMPDLSSVRHAGSEPKVERPASVAVAAEPSGDPLRATVQIRKVDPWSMLKLSLVISVSLFFVWMVAVGLLYAVLDGMGVWDRLNNAFTDIVANTGDAGLVSAGQIFGYAAVIGLINVVLFTALTTIGTFIYNLSSDLVGGLEVTLADRD